MKPIIGISTALNGIEGQNYMAIDEAYIRSIEQAGGLPVMLPQLEDLEMVAPLVEAIDGLLLAGGQDIDPSHYDEDPLPQTERTSMRRDESEMELFRQARRKHKPVLGICRGMQIVNVALGGGLIQDIPSQNPHALEHARPHIQASYHFIEVDEHSRLGQIVGTELVVNSIHHQGVAEAAPGLRVTATARDGMIEAVEMDGYLGLQFHPERLSDQEIFHQIFVDFVERCR